MSLESFGYYLKLIILHSFSPNYSVSTAMVCHINYVFIIPVFAHKDFIILNVIILRF